MDTPFIRRVTLRNYKSIAACQLDLHPLMFLVGPNGSGKSNLLDALAFVADGLRNSLDHALRSRGSIQEVRRRSGGHPNHFSIRLDFTLPDGRDGHYSFRIGAKKPNGFEVQSEECKLFPSEAVGHEHAFRVDAGKVVHSSVTTPPASLPDRLHLVAFSGLAEFRPVFDALSRMEVYNLNPQQIQSLQKPDTGDILRIDGGNAASVLQQMPRAIRDEISASLGEIVSGIESVEPKALGSMETMEFRQRVLGQQSSWRFPAASMSDGTLRALGILLAVFQVLGDEGIAPPLIGIEEPEAALHPAAAGKLLAALMKGSRQRQILVTSHSPDLLDNEDIPSESLLSVDIVDGKSIIGPIDDASRSALKDRLFTPGELLRANQLAPDPSTLSDVRDERQLKIFELNGN